MPLPQQEPLFTLWICLISVMPLREGQRPSSPCLIFGGNDTPGTWLPSPLSFPGEANGFLRGKSERAFHTWTLFPVSVCAVSHWNPGTAQDVEQAETHME